MRPTRGTAVAAGVFFLITEVAAIAGLLLYQPALSDANYVIGAGADNRVLAGGLLELVLVAAIVGSGVTLYPIVREQSRSVALGYLCTRLLEAAVILVGIVSVLSVVTLRRDLAGAPGAASTAFVPVGKALVAVHDWTFLLGPNVLLGANSLLLAYLMHRSRIVPRIITALGLIGGPLICLSATAVMFGLYEQVSTIGSVAALPVFAWEVSLAVYLIAKGFNPPRAIAGDIAPAERRVGVAAV
ncbi:DUF4386 domain-containing protein [Actinoplanes xinjiangensis]|uniref:Uncharacterized protein DUF4386 n=1 Tax=Actinoplanes xinjiangensis TaxID=512350 RepID=A0A316EGA4_9ACTN|nr:DUF4386 domain-containing protein [Actinoplanes xinjiangensis]PWK27747.1 uncharacterized protein DUF4386 [Actinoplanes xinjiangensis]GIF45168.1 hypothetical protein Axi01nite_94790 [Actinoplanes xinjiangensis]